MLNGRYARELRPTILPPSYRGRRIVNNAPDHCIISWRVLDILISTCTPVTTQTTNTAWIRFSYRCSHIRLQSIERTINIGRSVRWGSDRKSRRCFWRKWRRNRRLCNRQSECCPFRFVKTHLPLIVPHWWWGEAVIFPVSHERDPHHVDAIHNPLVHMNKSRREAGRPTTTTRSQHLHNSLGKRYHLAIFCNFWNDCAHVLFACVVSLPMHYGSSVGATTVGWLMLFGRWLHTTRYWHQTAKRLLLPRIILKATSSETELRSLSHLVIIL